MICWFDDVLLILIHGLAWFQVDLASPQLSPSFIHEISSILTPKSPCSAQNRAPELASRVDPDPPDDRQFTGRPKPLERQDVRHPLDDPNQSTEPKLRISEPTGRPTTGRPQLPDVRQTLTKLNFSPKIFSHHIHFRINIPIPPPLPHTSPIVFPLPNSDDFDTFLSWRI